MFFIQKLVSARKLEFVYKELSRLKIDYFYTDLITSVIEQRGQFHYTVKSTIISIILFLHMLHFLWLSLMKHFCIEPSFMRYDYVYLIINASNPTKYQLLTYSGIFFYSFLYCLATYFPKKKFLNTYLLYDVLTTRLDKDKTIYFKKFDSASIFHIRFFALLMNITFSLTFKLMSKFM